MEANESENRALIEAMERLGRVEVLHQQDGIPLIVAVPTGKSTKSLKPILNEFLDAPERKEGISTLTTLGAFCAFVNRHKQAKSIVFLDDTNPKAPQFRAIFDAHAGNQDAEFVKRPDMGVAVVEAIPMTAGQPDWEKHRAHYPLPMSDEWKAWTSMPKEFGQREFALFLEDRILDVLSPEEAEGSAIVKDFAEQLAVEIAPPSRLMELSRGLTVHMAGKVTNDVNAGSGESTLVFEEKHKDAGGQQLKVPGAFAIGIPVFRGGERYPVPVRLRYRVERVDGGPGKVWWSLSPQRLDKVLETALDDAQASVEEDTKLPVFRGAPS